MPFTEPSEPAWDGSYQVGLGKNYPTGSTNPELETISVGFLVPLLYSPYLVAGLTEEQLDSVFEQFRSDMAEAGFDVTCQKSQFSGSVYVPPTPE